MSANIASTAPPHPVARAPAGRAAPPQPRQFSGRTSWIVGLALAAIVVAFATWAVAQRVGDDEVAPPQVAALPDLGLLAMQQAADVRQLETTLRRAGYALPVDGVLDPVATSAAADYLRDADLSRLEPWIAGSLGRTIITGRRDPAAWNARFGEHRSTRMVERPLTGARGQLDENGNLRTSR